jgi:hypothetical protein
VQETPVADRVQLLSAPSLSVTDLLQLVPLQVGTGRM